MPDWQSGDAVIPLAPSSPSLTLFCREKEAGRR
ncbi:hypothetical protein PANA5342_2408 [Pantoea ananatis LMG 5342]|nr:hypothetical protein PANA5342_2408 [Pantoea ananatis LMG 5342]